ncbi:MAG: hypothetical protein ACI9UV_002895 [Algoriphagus sp.]|jgi:hypothetical protein
MTEISKREDSKNWIIVLLIIIITSFPWTDTQAQVTQKSYEILLAGFNIGTMEVEENKKGSIIEYNLESLVSFWFFGKVNVELTIKSTYKDGMMIKSESKSISNRGSFYSIIKWTGKSYLIDSHTYKFDNRESIPNLIPFSTVNFYFQEPKNGLNMISETFGLVSKITEIEPHGYEIEINGNRNKFFYENGEMDKALMENPIKNYVIKRIK